MSLIKYLIFYTKYRQTKIKIEAMTQEEFIKRIDDIMGTSSAERPYLEELYDEVTKPHWKSVVDELPPCNVFVLTCDRQENTNLLMLAGDGRWYDKAVGLHRNINRWMPMPSVEHLEKGDRE